MPIGKSKSLRLSSPRKRRVRKQIIADLSANYVERWALKAGYTVEFIHKDYGYDLHLSTFNAAGEFETGTIYIQLKATEHPKYSNDKCSFLFQADHRDLNIWFEEPLPVILIFYDATEEKAYWLYVQEYLEKLNNFTPETGVGSKRVFIPKLNLIDQNSFKQFREFKLNILKQIRGAITHA